MAKIIKQQSNKVVVKSNAIINASYRLTLSETRLLLACISQIDSTQPRNHEQPFTVHASAIADLVKDIKSETQYRDLKQAAKRLYERSIRIDTGDKIEDIRWIWKKAVYKSGQGAIELNFTPEVLHYLSELKGSFTQYKLQYVAKFQSSYSIRIYELLAQWVSTGSREITVDELRGKLQLEKQYPKVADLKRYCLDKAVDDINKYSNFRVEYGQRKCGRDIVAFQFTFKQKAEPPKEKKLTRREAIKKYARPGEEWPDLEARVKRDGLI